MVSAFVFSRKVLLPWKFDEVIVNRIGMEGR